MINTIKKSLKKYEVYFWLCKLYIPIKKLKNYKRYNNHYQKMIQDFKKLEHKNKILYIGIPIHNNLGDQAQYYCIKNFLSDNFSNYETIEIFDDIVFTNFKKTIKILKQNVDNTDIFVFQSGYRTTDVSNYVGEFTHRKILSIFKNKVIVFPQTVNFENKYEMKKSSLAYSKNNNYLFLARDKVSFEIAQKIYSKDRVYLFPDIVTTLIGTGKFYNSSKDGILLCLRNDSEKLYTDEQYDNLIKDLKNITDKVDITDTNSELNFEFDKSNIEKEIFNKIKKFSDYKLIITDRYHGTIFSLISNTKVIVLNSTDHKLSSGVDWFKGIYDDFVFYCEDFKNIYELAQNLYISSTSKINNTILKKEYYDKLKGYIDEK